MTRHGYWLGGKETLKVGLHMTFIKHQQLAAPLNGVCLPTALTKSFHIYFEVKYQYVIMKI